MPSYRDGRHHNQNHEMGDEEEEYEYDYGSDDYQSDGDMDENGSSNDVAIEIENSFYEGDDEKAENPTLAITKFERVLELAASQQEFTKWKFKALYNLVLLNCTLRKVQQMVAHYRQMLSLIGTVSKNESSDAINTVLDALSTSPDQQALAEMYEITLVALRTAQNDRLWFSTNLKLARVYLDTARLSQVEAAIEVLKGACRLRDGTPDPSKAASQLEVACLEIQLCSASGDPARLRQVFKSISSVSAAVADPRVMVLINNDCTLSPNQLLPPGAHQRGAGKASDERRRLGRSVPGVVPRI